MREKDKEEKTGPRHDRQRWRESEEAGARKEWKSLSCLYKKGQAAWRLARERCDSRVCSTCTYCCPRRAAGVCPERSAAVCSSGHSFHVVALRRPPDFLSASPTAASRRHGNEDAHRPPPPRRAHLFVIETQPNECGMSGRNTQRARGVTGRTEM